MASGRDSKLLEPTIFKPFSLESPRQRSICLDRILRSHTCVVVPCFGTCHRVMQYIGQLRVRALQLANYVYSS